MMLDDGKIRELRGYQVKNTIDIEDRRAAKGPNNVCRAPLDGRLGHSQVGPDTPKRAAVRTVDPFASRCRMAGAWRRHFVDPKPRRRCRLTRMPSMSALKTAIRVD